MDFLTYLKGVFYKERPEVLDDDLTEAFDSWLASKDVQEMIVYADQFGKDLARETLAVLRDN